MTLRRAIRLGAALLGAALLMSALTTAIAFVVYGSWEFEAYAVHAKTRAAALAAVSAFLVFNSTLGLATILSLRRIGRTGPGAHALGGAIAGLAFGGATALIFGDPVKPAVLLALMVIGALMLLLTRMLAGVGRTPPESGA